MKTRRYMRKGNVIHTCADVSNKAYPSINEAKRESRRLQMEADGALGRGTLSVSEKLPSVEASNA